MLLLCIVFSGLNVLKFSVYAQPLTPDSLYPGQTPPGIIRKIFNLIANPGNSAVGKLAISPDGKAFYYQATNSSRTSSKLKYYGFFNNKWNGSVDLLHGFLCLSPSPYGHFLYFEDINYNDCWISDQPGTARNPPVRFFGKSNVHSLNVPNSGKFYLSSNPAGGQGQREMCKLNVENIDTSLPGLGLPVKSGTSGGGFFVARDGAFMIFMSNRSGGSGTAGLTISYSKSDNTLTNPKITGPSVNTSVDDFRLCITTGNKYLIYERDYAIPGSMYRVRVDQLIDSNPA